MVRKQIQKELVNTDEGNLFVPAEDIDTAGKYDLIIVLNSIYKKGEYLPYLNALTPLVAEDGLIIDPFIFDGKLHPHGAQRGFVRSWLGVPNRKAQKFSVNEYMDIIS